MRSEIVLFEIVLADLSKKGVGRTGICERVYRLSEKELITHKEEQFLLCKIRDYKPSKFFLPKYTRGKYWNGDAYWWREMWESPIGAKQVRVRYLKDLIKHLKEKAK